MPRGILTAANDKLDKIKADISSGAITVPSALG